VRDVLLGAGASLALSLLGGLYVMNHLSEAEAGALVVLAVVFSGLASSAATFHLLRLGAARRFRATAVPRKLIELHLEGGGRG
jgi:hypothetical protein